MKKKILKKLLNNLPLKILSILIAIVIWYVVVSVNDPIVKERFDVPVQVTNEAYIAAGKKTYQIAEEYQTVTVTVTDNNSVVSRLKASDITVTADLTQIVTMDTNPVYVPIKAACSMVQQEQQRSLWKSRMWTAKNSRSQLTQEIRNRQKITKWER